MSIKIYNGYLLKIKDLNELFDFSFKVRNLIGPLRLDYFLSEMVSSAVKSFDRINAGLPADIAFRSKSSDSSQLKKDILFETYCHRTGVVGEKGNLDSEFLKKFMKFDLVIYQANGKILAQTFTGNTQLTSEFEKLPEVEEYAYFNNSEQPDEISDEDWNVRRQDWDVALINRSGIPSQCGLTIQTWDELFPRLGNRDDLNKYIPDYESRLNILIKSIFIEKYTKDNKKDIKDFEDKNEYERVCMRSFYDALDAYEKLKVEDLEVLKADIKPRFKIDLTIKDLMDFEF